MGLSAILFFLLAFYAPFVCMDILLSYEGTKYPYVVSLIYSSPNGSEVLVRSCSGTAIKKDWILTAASCLSDSLAYVQYEIIKSKLKKNKLKSAVLRMIKHPDYEELSNESWPRNDIGLISVEKLKIKKFGELVSDNYTSIYGANVTYSGFEKYELADSLPDALDRPLFVVDGIINQCPSEKVFGDLTSYICVSPTLNYTLFPHGLPSDIGGPLIYNDKIIGVLSHVIPKHVFRHTAPKAVFSPISQHWLWIHKVLLEPNLGNARKKLNLHLKSH